MSSDCPRVRAAVMGYPRRTSVRGLARELSEGVPLSARRECYLCRKHFSVAALVVHFLDNVDADLLVNERRSVLTVVHPGYRDEFVQVAQGRGIEVAS